MSRQSLTRSDYTSLIMQSVSVTEAKAHLSRLLERVRQGESILLLHRGRPIARLEPVDQNASCPDARRFQHLVRSGLLTRATEPPDPEWLARPGPEAPEGAGLLAALLDDREEGR